MGGCCSSCFSSGSQEELLSPDLVSYCWLLRIALLLLLTTSTHRNSLALTTLFGEQTSVTAMEMNCNLGNRKCKVFHLFLDIISRSVF